MESTCFNLASFPYAVDVDLSKKSLKKLSNMIAANHCHEASHSLESSTAGAPLWRLKCFLFIQVVMGLLRSK